MLRRNSRRKAGQEAFGQCKNGIVEDLICFWEANWIKVRQETLNDDDDDNDGGGGVKSRCEILSTGMQLASQAPSLQLLSSVQLDKL